MRTIRLLAVGRLKTPHFKAAAEHYAKRISHTARFEEQNVKDADPDLPIAERKDREGKGLAKLLRPNDVLVCMDEHGKHLTSREFATFIERCSESGRTPCFIVGGAYGLSPEILAQAKHTICLSAMTFPHELARVVLLEQIYRAENILSNTGYHH